MILHCRVNFSTFGLISVHISQNINAPLMRAILVRIEILSNVNTNIIRIKLIRVNLVRTKNIYILNATIDRIRLIRISLTRIYISNVNAPKDFALRIFAQFPFHCLLDLQFYLISYYSVGGTVVISVLTLKECVTSWSFTHTFLIS